MADLLTQTEEDVVDGLPINLGVARHQRTQWNGAKVVGADAAERAAITAKGGADGIADEGLGGHGDSWVDGLIGVRRGQWAGRRASQVPHGRGPRRCRST